MVNTSLSFSLAAQFSIILVLIVRARVLPVIDAFILWELEFSVKSTNFNPASFFLCIFIFFFSLFNNTGFYIFFVDGIPWIDVVVLI